MATNLRIILHDTKKSKSLFTQLNMKGILYVSTTDLFIPVNEVSYHGLLAVSSTNKNLKYIAKGMNDSCEKLLKFDDWWNEVVIYDLDNMFSRKDLLLTVANKDGGAHIDPFLSQAFIRLSKENSLGWKSAQGLLEKDIKNNPVYASIRQISEEFIYSYTFSLLKTLSCEPNNESYQRYIFDGNRYFMVKNLVVTKERIDSFRKIGQRSRTDKEIATMIRIFDEKVFHGYERIGTNKLTSSSKASTYTVIKHWDEFYVRKFGSVKKFV